MPKYNVLVLSNLLATPCPTWSSFVTSFSWPVSASKRHNTRPPSISSETTLVDNPKERLRIVSPPPTHGRLEIWHLLDCTGQILEEASASSDTIFPEVHIVILLINTADYSPRHYRDSARFERDQALLRNVCSAGWLGDASVVVCLDDIDATAAKFHDTKPCEPRKSPSTPLPAFAGCGCCIFPFPLKGKAERSTSVSAASEGKSKEEKSPLMVFMDTIISGFKDVGAECDERDVRAYFLQADERDVELETALEWLLDFLKNARYESRLKKARKLA